MCLLINLQAVKPLPMMLLPLFRLAFNHGKLLITADRNPSLGETMKRLRQLCAATALTILLTTVAAAEGNEGVMHPWYVPPPPPAEKMTAPQTSAGEAHIASEEQAVDLATEITLGLVQSMLALF